MDFETVYETYFGDVYRYLLRMTGSESLAEELTAETFFKAMKAVDGFRGDCDVRVWLCKIAKNQYLTHLKKTAAWPTRTKRRSPCCRTRATGPPGRPNGRRSWPPCGVSCTRCPSPIKRYLCGAYSESCPSKRSD